MHSFTDAAGRPWQIAINVTSIKRVKGLLQVDLLDVLNEKSQLLQRLAYDPALLCDVLFALCQPQAQAAGVSDEQFGEGLAGDALDAAAEAMLEELADFFPKDRRAVLKKILRTRAELEGAAGRRLEQIMDDSDGAVRAGLEALMGRAEEDFMAELKKLGGRSGDSAEAAESIPVR